MKRALSAAMCFALALGLLAGCGSLDEVELDVSEPPTASTEPPDTAALELDWDEAREKYDPETTVLTVDGDEVNWGEFFYWLNYCYTSYAASMGAVSDFDTPYIYDNSMTIGSMLIDAAKSY